MNAGCQGQSHFEFRNVGGGVPDAPAVQREVFTPFSGECRAVATRGVREAECAQLLSDFFQKLRVELRSRPKWKKP